MPCPSPSFFFLLLFLFLDPSFANAQLFSVRDPATGGSHHGAYTPAHPVAGKPSTALEGAFLAVSSLAPGQNFLLFLRLTAC